MDKGQVGRFQDDIFIEGKPVKVKPRQKRTARKSVSPKVKKTITNRTAAPKAIKKPARRKRRSNVKMSHNHNCCEHDSCGNVQEKDEKSGWFTRELNDYLIGMLVGFIIGLLIGLVL